MIFDGHLDLAMLALLNERDITGPLQAIRDRETPAEGDPNPMFDDGRGRAGLTLESLRGGDVGLCLSTLLARVKPWKAPQERPGLLHTDWPHEDMAYAAGQGMLAYYRRLEQRGLIRLIHTATQLQQHASDHDAGATDCLGVIVTMEGADAICEPEQLHEWHEQGLRTLMLAHFGRSRFAHGTPSRDPSNRHDVEGPVTDLGRALLREMEALKMPLDLSHTSDTSFDDAAGRFGGAIYSSHSGAREVADVQRNHTDAQLREIFERGGLVGVPLFNAYLRTDYDRHAGPGQVTLDTVVDHLDHLCQIAGNADQVGIGSDFDGGFGVEHTPDELDSTDDLPKLGEALQQRGYSDDAIHGVLSGNWIRFMAANLPA